MPSPSQIPSIAVICNCRLCVSVSQGKNLPSSSPRRACSARVRYGACRRTSSPQMRPPLHRLLGRRRTTTWPENGAPIARFHPWRLTSPRSRTSSTRPVHRTAQARAPPPAGRCAGGLSCRLRPGRPHVVWRPGPGAATDMCIASGHEGRRRASWRRPSPSCGARARPAWRRRR
jgi:hypothetical protein